MTILSVRHLTKIFRLHALGGKEICGCAGVSFDLKPGQFIGLAGPSGSGKSSVLKCIYRTYLPTAGSAWYRRSDGSEIDLAAAVEEEILELRRREIAYVTQFLKVAPRVPALDIVAERLLRNGWNREAARSEAADLLRRLRIPAGLWDASPVTFSGGEQQRVNLARALAARPRVLLLDEPTASLDAVARATVVDLLQERKAEGTSMIGIFHDHETARQLVDDLFPMEHGAFAVSGSN